MCAEFALGSRRAGRPEKYVCTRSEDASPSGGERSTSSCCQHSCCHGCRHAAQLLPRAHPPRSAMGLGLSRFSPPPRRCWTLLAIPRPAGRRSSPTVRWHRRSPAVLLGSVVSAVDDTQARRRSGRAPGAGFSFAGNTVQPSEFVKPAFAVISVAFSEAMQARVFARRSVRR